MTQLEYSIMETLLMIALLAFFFWLAIKDDLKK
jgi:hypothetical protein